MAKGGAPQQSSADLADVQFEHHLNVLRFHQEMHFELIYAQRQILVIIQALFGNIPHGYHQPLVWAWPIGVETFENIDQFIKKEDMNVIEWFKTVRISLDLFDNLIEDEQRQLHPGQDPPPKLNSNQKKAKYLEMAASGFAYLDKHLINKGNLLFGEYANACQNSTELQSSFGENRAIKQAALKIWFKKTHQLMAKIKKVLDLQNWLLRVAEVFYDQPKNKLNQQLEQQLFRILSRAYFRLHPTADEVPTGDFINMSWKVFGFGFDNQLKKSSDDKLIWYDPETLKNNPTFFKVSLNELKRRREERGGAPAKEVGEPPISEVAEPGEGKKPDTKHVLNIKIFGLFQDLHRELLWGRRQIILVIQMIFGDFDKQQFEWPDEDNGAKFEINIREGIDLKDWKGLFENNFGVVLNELRQEQPAFDKLSLNFKQIKYVDVAFWGIRHFKQFLNILFCELYKYQTECKTSLKAMQEVSPEERTVLKKAYLMLHIHLLH